MNAEIKAKLEEMARNSPDTARGFMTGAAAAWDLAIEHEMERIKTALTYLDNRRKLAYSMRGESKHIYAFMEATCTQFNEILNPPEQKEEGG